MDPFSWTNWLCREWSLLTPTIKRTVSLSGYEKLVGRTRPVSHSNFSSPVCAFLQGDQPICWVYISALKSRNSVRKTADEKVRILPGYVFFCVDTWLGGGRNSHIKPVTSFRTFCCQVAKVFSFILEWPRKKCLLLLFGWPKITYSFL